MSENKQTEDQFWAKVRGDKRQTHIEICVPTFWLWVTLALILTTRFPALWSALQDILQSQPF